MPLDWHDLEITILPDPAPGGPATLRMTVWDPFVGRVLGGASCPDGPGTFFNAFLGSDNTDGSGKGAYYLELTAGLDEQGQPRSDLGQYTIFARHE